MKHRGHYVIGDEVAVRVRLQHRSNLISVDLVYAHPVDDNIKLILSGVPEEWPNKDDEERVPDLIYSETLATEEVGLEHIDGRYELISIELGTAGGLSFSLKPDSGDYVKTDHYSLLVYPEEKKAWVELSLEIELTDEVEE
jgi:hypothetical protein